MRSGPSRLTAPSVWFARPYVAPTSASSRRPDGSSSSPTRTNGRRGSNELREHVEQRGPLLERVDQAAVRADLLGPQLVEQPGGAADEELPVVLDRVERAADRVEERALPRRELGLVEGAAQEPRAEPDAGEALAEVVGGPGDEAQVDRVREDVALLRDAAGRGDDDDHHDVRLQRQHLDVADRRRLERRRGDEREQPRQLRRAPRSSPAAPPRSRRAPPAARARGRAAAAPAARAARRRRRGSRPRSGRGPADVCGCVSRPCRSRSASSARTVDDETSKPARSTSVFDPTGCAARDVLLDDPAEDLPLPIRQRRRSPSAHGRSVARRRTLAVARARAATACHARPARRPARRRAAALEARRHRTHVRRTTGGCVATDGSSSADTPRAAALHGVRSSAPRPERRQIARARGRVPGLARRFGHAGAPGSAHGGHGTRETARVAVRRGAAR